MNVDTSAPVRSEAPSPSDVVTASRRRLTRWRPGGSSLIALVVTLLVIWLVAVPLGFLVFTSFRDTRVGLPFESQTPFTLENYRQVFSSGRTWDILRVTTIYAVGSVAIALVITVTFAYLLERTDLRFRRTILAMILAPLALPPFIAGMAWTVLGNPRTGLANTTIRGIFNLDGDGPINIFSIPWMIVITGLLFVPSMYLMVSGTFGQMDQSLEEASWVSGVPRWTSLFRVTLPVLLPGIAAAILYFTVTGFEIYEIPALLGLRERNYTLSTWAVYVIDDPNAALPHYGLASVYGVLTVLVVAVLLAVYWRVIQRRKNSFGTISGRGFRRHRVSLGRWNHVALTAAALYCLFAFVLPVGVLAWRSLLPTYSSMTDFGELTLANYRRMVEGAAIRDAAVNSLQVSVATALLGTLLATGVAWLSIRSRSKWSQVADQLTFLSMGMPGAILAISCILVYLWLPLPIYGTIWIIVLGLVARYLAFGVRVMSAALLQVRAELEEASWTAGVGNLGTLLRIVIPLVRPSVNRTALWMFVNGFRDATIAIVVASATNGTLATEIWLTWFEGGDVAFASAMAMPIAIASILLTVLIGRQYRSAPGANAPVPTAVLAKQSAVAKQNEE